jgi:acetyltransferase-like isoleucine patch superfamily enzyme
VRQRLLQFIRSLLDPRAWFHAVRVVHFLNTTHVQPLRAATVGRGARISPTASFRNGRRLVLGDEVHVGERCCIWAGDSTGRITIGDHALFGPEVFITASNYETRVGDVPVMHQRKLEADVVIGRDVWLGARVVVLPGVTVGDGAIVGAASVVSRDLPPNAIAVGAPARIVGSREAVVEA